MDKLEQYLTTGDAVDSDIAEEPSLPIMKVLDPLEMKTDVEDGDRTQEITDDFHNARQLGWQLLQQQQEMIKSMAMFTNTCPSPRAYEVMNAMMKTAQEMNRDMMALQKDMEDLGKKGVVPGTEAPGVTHNTLVIAGGPSDILDMINAHRNPIIENEK